MLYFVVMLTFAERRYFLNVSPNSPLDVPHFEIGLKMSSFIPNAYFWRRMTSSKEFRVTPSWNSVAGGRTT